MHQLATRLFAAVGASLEDARLVAGELITSSLMGHDSHGVLRIPEYLDLVARGAIRPDALITVEPTSATTAVVDCGHGFGAVGGRKAIDVACQIAIAQRTACVITQRCHHVGRLGAYVEAAARRGLIAMATCNSPPQGHVVLPWGGRAGRLATNPIAYGVPTGGDPIVADFATSIAPEGKIRYHRNEKRPVPQGWIVDAEGRPTTDAAAFYGPPLGGILPLGGTAGHKGFALSLLVEILGSCLAGHASTDASILGNGVCFIVVDPAAFYPLDNFKRYVDETVAYIKSSPPAPGFSEVLVPGEIEFRNLRRRQAEGITVDEVTWQAIVDHAQRLEVEDGLLLRDV